MDTQELKGNEQIPGATDLAGGASDKGPTRSDNQDAFWIPDVGTDVSMGMLYLVADGVGGQESGADAAQLAVKNVQRVFYDSRQRGSPIPDALNEALLQANQAVYQEAQRRQVRRMGATFVAAVTHQGRLTIAHVGDARAYLIRQNGMQQLTRDDTWVQKQVEAGLLTEEQAAKHEYRNIVTQVLGNKQQVDVHLSQPHILQQNDLVLLCSDGLYDVLSESEMLTILSGNPPPAAAQQLVKAAIDAEAGDNITAVVIKPATVTTMGAETTVPLAAIEQQPTLLVTAENEPALPPEPADGPVTLDKYNRKTSNWLIALAAAALILIIAALLLFWLRNRDLNTVVESAAGTEMTATAIVVDDMTPDGVGALRPLPTITADTSLSLADDTSQTATPTELPPPTPTLRAVSSIAATLEPRGCANDELVAFVWSQEQVENGTCDSTPYRLDVGDEVRVLEETAITAVGECNNIQVIKVQSISAPDVEGWVDQDAIDRLDPGSSCSP